MKKYKTLLFDIDGTLLDFDATEQYALKTTFEKHGINYTKELYDHYESINKPLWQQFEEGLIDKKTVVYTRFVQLFKERHIDLDGIKFEDEYQDALGQGFFLMKDAIEVLDYCSQHYDLYVVTNGVCATQYSRIDGTHIRHYFKKLFVSEEIGYQKPMIEYFQYCFNHIDDFDLSRTLIIGDTLSSDILGGINASIDTCWLNTKGKENINHLPITFEIHELREILNIL